ncbi:acyltransferase family protein [Gordonia sp. KTR9]|uniref:acyltransferase family protein n=1 Tax=Gordonia sp. KTR9 TaxID=337191 RepID=UPI00027DDC64|nr:acyltransferase family protein [Gordonia sp. KTR9]AFR47691.1 Fucose 4-O-acetylase-related acetyltransferase [Gordonia sp. KTR9]
MPLDLLRVLGIVAIVAGHVWDNLFTREAIFTWHVPLFFFLTGYLWTTTRSLGTEVRKRSRTLLVPYVCWLVLISVPYVGLSVFRDSKQPAPLIGDILWGGAELGRPYSAFWFVTALFFAAVLLRSMQRLPRWTPWALSIVGLVVCYTYSSAVAALPLSLGVAVPATLFVLAGVSFRSVREHIRRPAVLGAAALLVSGVLIISGLSGPMDMKQADFGTPALSVIVAAAISAGLILVAEHAIRWKGRVADWTTRLAAAGFMVVLTHAVVLWLLRTPPTGSWVDFGAALLLPWAAALTLALTSLSRYLLGVDRRRKKRLALGGL